MVYSDIEKYGFLGIVPPPKSGGYRKNNKSARKAIKDAILKNKDFIQFVLRDKKADYINDILGSCIEWILKCNEVYYCYKK